ncbi:uncharacterized protein LOC131624886 [Vicia villosa]|uniref:uncharacterized protein LOC131624691 n=1 Tax=Vicia villosa TaxID=3911 RepID=UPI00273BE99E|nr:uncharacterized protein LOC131624691 [Vicia villosa]XP_058751818.1 uncharacterized protein LOC131624886 [Vicia villosa]
MLKPDGSIGKHKTMLLAIGFLHKYGLDYFKVFAPVARHETIRLVIAIAANRNGPLMHLDVKYVFLNGPLQEDVYVSQPPRFVKRNQEGMVLEGHAFSGRLTTDEKQHVVDLTKRHVPPRHILISLKEQDPENVTRIMQLWTALIRQTNIDNLCLKLLKDLCPQVILTNRDFALMKTVKVVFPTMINLLCRFDINKNVGAKCKQYVVNDMQETIDSLWMDVVWASDDVEYSQRLQQLEQTCFDYSELIDYVKDTWLIPHRVESAYWKLKQMLGNSIGDMVKCWEAMNDNLNLQIGNIQDSFRKSVYEVEHAHISPFYGNLQGSVFRAALRRIAEEISRIYYVGSNMKKCGCTNITNYGLPCACELGRYVLGGISIPIDSVDEEDGSEVDMSSAIDKLWRRFRSLDVVRKIALKSRVCELVYPTKTSMCPPPEKIKTKGGVKKKGKKPNGYDVYRDPSYHEYVDESSQSSQRQYQPSHTSKKQSQSKKQSPSKKH